MTDTFRTRLLRGERLIGTIASIAASEAVEILADCGFDWLFIETEHAPVGPAELHRMISAAPNIPCVVRLPNHDEINIKRALDAGAAGIIAPQVNTVEQARAIVAYAKYPPAGRRGVGISRANGYGYQVGDYAARANQDTAVIVQAEHIDAVINIDEIVAVPGVDAIFIGPYDLSASMGKLGQLSDPEVVAAINKIRDTALKAGLKLGFYANSPELVTPQLAAGFTLAACGVDVLFIRQGAKSVVEALKRSSNKSP